MGQCHRIKEDKDIDELNLLLSFIPFQGMLVWRLGTLFNTDVVKCQVH